MTIANYILSKIKESNPFKRTQEQSVPEFAGASGLTIDPDEDLFRRLSQTTRDKDPLTYERSVNISYWMYSRNGFYKRLIDISLQAIASAGVKMVTEDETIQEAWEEFWGKPITGISNWFFKDMKEVSLSGEADWPLAMNPINGDLEIGYVDPLNVKHIKMLPGNVRVPDKLFMKDRMMQADNSGKVFDIVKSQFGLLVGELIHFPINKPVNASRGLPALLAVIDHVDLYDQVFFNEAERILMKKLFIWDVKRTGSDDATNTEWIRKQFPGGQPPKAASVRVHNENEEWNEVSPSMDSSDSSEGIRMIRQGTAGGAGYPDFFFGWGGDVNVATAREMLGPTMWMIEWQQTEIVGFLTELFSVQLQAWDHRKHLESGLVKSEGAKWEIKANKAFPKGFVVQAQAFSQVSGAIAGAEASGIIGKKTATKMFVDSANELDYNLNLSEVQEEIDEQPEKDMFGSPKVEPNSKEKSDITFNEIMRMSKRTAGDNGTD